MQIDVYVLTAHKHAKARENKSVKKKLCIIDEKKKMNGNQKSNCVIILTF